MKYDVAIRQKERNSQTTLLLRHKFLTLIYFKVLIPPQTSVAFESIYL